MTAQRLEELLEKISSLHVLVAGDLMLDEFIWGHVRRISPEAPVPVVEVQRESAYPGGAANVARSLREFCASAEVLGGVGADAAGTHLRKLLEEAGIGMAGVLEQSGRPTIVKTRIIARQQQVVRVDRETRSPMEQQTAQALLDKYAALLPTLHAVILQDYGKGFFTQWVVDNMVRLARDSGVIVTADINPSNPLVWKNLDAVKPNRAEAFAAAGVPWSDPIEPAANDNALLDVGRKLRLNWGCNCLLITLGEQGMMLFDEQTEPCHIPTRAREVFDVSGAGDTAIALFTLALAAGANPREAADISNHASGIVVGKLGTATVTPYEIRDSFANLD